MENKFTAIFGDKYQLEYFSPGRVNIIGEHIDYNGGLVLPMAIDIGTHGYVSFNDNHIVRVYSENFPDIGIIEFTLTELKNVAADNWANYVKGVIDTFQKAGHQIQNGFNLYVNGTIPNGSGLSSSASLEVLVGQILIDNNNLKVSGTELALLTQKAENQFIGVNCGIMDQFIIANASQEGALLINCDSLEYETVKFDLGSNKIVVLNSNKKRGLVDSEYNQRRLGCEQVLAIAKQKYPINQLCELSYQQFEDLALTDNLYKLTKHVVTENIRVKETVLALEGGDVALAGQLLSQSHASLRDDFEVSCEELDYIVEQVMLSGALGARMTGAGFGGCVVAIINQDAIDKLQEVATKYHQKFGLKLEFYVVNSNDKVKQIKESL